MENATQLFEVLKQAYEQDLGIKYFHDLKNDDQFLVVDTDYAPHNEQYELHTTKFVIQVSLTYQMGDQEKDKGTWNKEWEAENVTEKYKPFDKESIEPYNRTDKQIVKWIKSHVMDFVPAQS